jgi:hypothetical protein
VVLSCGLLRAKFNAPPQYYVVLEMFIAIQLIKKYFLLSWNKDTKRSAHESSPQDTTLS